MAKKAPAKKAPAKRKPRAKKPVDNSISEEFGKITPDDMRRVLDALRKPPLPSMEEFYDSLDGRADPTKPIAWRSWLVGGAKTVALIVCGAVAGVYAAGGIPIGPGPVVRNDVLQQSHAADRVTQIAVLRDLANQSFDGTTDDGRKQAETWFNAQRFRNRPNDYRPYTDAVAESISTNSENELAEKLEAQ
jgi:hypothetical protein